MNPSEVFGQVNLDDVVKVCIAAGIMEKGKGIDINMSGYVLTEARRVRAEATNGERSKPLTVEEVRRYHESYLKSDLQFEGVVGQSE